MSILQKVFGLINDYANGGVGFSHLKNLIESKRITWVFPDITIQDCEFSHTAMTGLLASMTSNLVIDRNVFTDIGNMNFKVS